MKSIDVNKSNENYIKLLYGYNFTNKKPKFKIDDIVSISLKR